MTLIHHLQVLPIIPGGRGQQQATGPRAEKNIKCDLCTFRCAFKKSLEEHMR